MSVYEMNTQMATAKAVTSILFSYENFDGDGSKHLIANWALLLLLYAGIATCSPTELIAWFPVFLAIQIGVCLKEKCQGVSLIWAAITGVLIEGTAFGRYSSPSAACKLLAPTGISASAVAIIAYAVIAPPVTTVAHVLAVLLGMVAAAITSAVGMKGRLL